MSNNYIKSPNPNCECQCHYPPSIICPITRCCHCIPNEIPISNNFSPYSSISSFYKPGKEQNLNLMNSYSTNFRSNNADSIGFQRSGDYINSDYYLNKTRNNQNKPNQFLGRNLSEPNNHIYKNQNNNEEQNIIYQEPYINNSIMFQSHSKLNKSNNNSNIMNQSYNTINQSNLNYKSPLSNDNNNVDNNKNNLTYDYYNNCQINTNKKEYNCENENENELEQSNTNNKLCPIISPVCHSPSSPQEKIHDMVSILQKENEFLKNQRDDALNKLSALENIKNIDRVKFEELENENNELRLLLNDAMKKNNDKDTMILNLKNDINNLQNAMHDKDREINDLILNMKRLEQDANNELDKLRNKIDDLQREKEAMARNFQKEINDLNNVIRDLNNKLADEERKVKELLNKIKNMKRFDEKKEKLLENLFNWYNTINKLLNTNTANGKAPPKELLADIVNLQTNEEFKNKLDQIEDKLKQFIDNYKLKFGECFACDIACCTSEVDRLKYFRKYYPGPPKNYLEGRKKCKCP